MQNSAKYLIHAEIRTSGVVERSDVVGAIFGQTEGLLGGELDLRNLKDASKVGHIDVDIESEGGRSYGTVTVASGLDRVETAVLAAALETIERVGPCRAECTVTDIEDARAAKRRKLVDRATELLANLEEATMTSDELVAAVRERARVEDVTTFEGMPAGPRVADSDAIIVVEGRADVRRLLRYGIKNAIAVEGTDVPDAVAQLTKERTVTAFLDGDRGGDLVLEELAQVGEVDYVAFAPADRSVEELEREEIVSALRRKLPYSQVAEGRTPRETFEPADGGDDAPTVVDSGNHPTVPSAESGPLASVDGTELAGEPIDDGDTTDADGTGQGDTGSATPPGSASTGAVPSAATERGTGGDEREPDTPDGDDTEPAEAGPETLAGHAADVDGTGRVRLLDDSFGVIAAGEADEAFDLLVDSEDVPVAVVLDGTLTQRVLDVAAQRGVGQVVATSTGEFVKQPTGVRVRTVDQLDVEVPS
ncbi:MAG: DNA primase DnaG [Halovenus sp.]